MSESRQYNFLNQKQGLTLSFLDGKDMLDEINRIHNIGPLAISFYQKTLLGITHFVNLLKPGENLGLYIDSEDPYFRFKIELAHNGQFRTLLLPEEFNDLPLKFSGQCRLSKVLPNSTPYNTVLEYNDFPLEEIVNDILARSYQVPDRIELLNENQSYMLAKLPADRIQARMEGFEDTDLKSYLSQHKASIDKVLNMKDQFSQSNLEELLADLGFQFLGSKQISFHCPCSKARMIRNLNLLPTEDKNHLFDEKKEIETRCDYCNTIYTITEDEIIPLQ